MLEIAKIKKAQGLIVGLIILIIVIIAFLWFLFIYKPSQTGKAIQEIEKIVCNAPYMRVGVSCCLDKDNNKICDKDEEENKENNVNLTTEETPEQEIKAKLSCISNCRGIDRDKLLVGDKIWGTPIVSLKSFYYSKVGSKYEVRATFKSNTACPVIFKLSGGEQTAGLVELEGFGIGELVVETDNLFNLKIYAGDNGNNYQVEGYQCNGMINSVAFGFI